MTGLLASMQPRSVAAGSKKPPLETSVPAATAPPQHAMFDLLRRPQLALGQGLILKRMSFSFYSLAARDTWLKLMIAPTHIASWRFAVYRSESAIHVLLGLKATRDIKTS